MKYINFTIFFIATLLSFTIANASSTETLFSPPSSPSPEWSSFREKVLSSLLNKENSLNNETHTLYRKIINFLQNPTDESGTYLAAMLDEFKKDTPSISLEHGQIITTSLTVVQEDFRFAYAFSDLTKVPAFVVQDALYLKVNVIDSQKYGMWFLEGDLDRNNTLYFSTGRVQVRYWSGLLIRLANSPLNDELRRYLLEYPFARGSAAMSAAYRHGASQDALVPGSDSNMLDFYYKNIIIGTELQSDFEVLLDRRGASKYVSK